MRIIEVMLIAALFGGTGCSSPDDASGEMHLVLVQAPETATPGSPASLSIIVKVVDGDGAGTAGVPVTWSTTTYGGEINTNADTSGVDGLAAALWTPGLAPGEQAVLASIYDQPALVITVNAETFRADKIATLYRSGCGIRNGATWCWGYGFENSLSRATVTRVMSHVQARDVAMAGSQLCLLDEAGSVHCRDMYANPDPDQDIRVNGLPMLSAITGGGFSFCGLAQADSSLWCWQPRSLNVYQIDGMPSLAQVTTGTGGVCGLTADGTAWCGGAKVAGGLRFRQLSVGFGVCGIVNPARLYCWDSSHPEPSYFGIYATMVAAGSSAAIIKGATGASEFYWWSIDPLQYHLGDTFTQPVVQLSAGDDTPCVVTSDASVYCLGVNDNIEQIYKTTWEAIPAPLP